MQSDSPDGSFLYSDLREKREGVQFERTLRGLSFVLHEWSQYTGDRKPLYELDVHPQVLTVIQFDKLALFTFRVWNEVYRRQLRSLKPNHLQVPMGGDDAVTFPSPFVELPGKHGRGPARFGGKSKPIYIVDSLYALQNEGIYYFQITPPTDSPKDPKDYRTIVASAERITNPNQFLSGFTSREIEILKELANALKRLGPSEIRALGTHENHHKSVEDIRKEFTDMEPHRMAVVEGLQSNQLFRRSSKEFLEYADEAWRKSIYNRRDYAGAHQIMSTEIGDPELRAAFGGCQSTPERIWDPS
ncbi:MAG TPA: hypothetical protein VJS64_00885, partial [Pyrinomonadaceae bacterium]|nr:hypothetical protein [Pyrinomonadaceae bacterium]